MMDIKRILLWSTDPDRKPAKVESTGEEQQVAYLLMWAEDQLGGKLNASNMSRLQRGSAGTATQGE